MIDEGLYRRASEVFLSLLELPAEARLASLRARSDLDDTLRRAVRDLLDHHAEDSFLENGPPGLETLEGHLGPSLPAQIGGYRIERLVGYGGMGAVFEVHQDSVGRRAALKVVHSWSGDEHALKRFQLEIDVLARLDHPGIARIYDAGLDTSEPVARPYFVMEFIQGAPIDEWARAEQATIDDVVDVFLLVCEAVEHAHQRGVIHRDLKPANVLIDDRGTPRILDFGIARPTDQNVSLSPISGEARSVVGTLAYMSPEQCSLDACIDIRTDVYSLGVLLYELLDGNTPIDVKDMSVVRAARRICEETPRTPSHRGSRLPRDLEAIVLHALEKSPTQRYQSAPALSDDLRRYRRGLPVSARRPSQWTRAMGWAARHPIAATTLAATTVVLLITASTAVSIWWLSMRPHAVMPGPGLHEAQLLSQVGSELYTWQNVTEIRPQVIDRPAEFGGGQIVILDQFGKGVSAYALDDPAVALWSTSDFDMTPPTPTPSKAAVANVTYCLVADFLEDVPGEEILVVTKLVPHSPNVLRVLDSGGHLLYEVWHEGGISGVTWIPESRRLLCSAHNSSKTWFERGTDIQTQSWPMVVFALEIRKGHRRPDGYITAPSYVDPTVAWYRWVGPLEDLAHSRRLQPDLKPMSVNDPYRVMAQFRIVVADTQDEYVSMILDGDGGEFDRVISDWYRTAHGHGQLPDPWSWSLFDLSELPMAADEPTAR